MDELLKSYSSIPVSLETASTQISAYSSGCDDASSYSSCPADTSDCSTDAISCTADCSDCSADSSDCSTDAGSCTSDCNDCNDCSDCNDCNDCSDCSDTTPTPSFSCTIGWATDTTADLTAVFTGGDASYSRSRYVRVVLNSGATFVFASSKVGGASSLFSGTITGLTPDTTYTWTATLGYVGDDGSIVYTSYTASGSFTTTGGISTVSPWDWTASNGSATATETRNAYSVLTGAIPAADNFSHKVWNDIADKILEVLSAYGLSWNSTYTTHSGATVNTGDYLSAKIYNSLLCNVKQFASVSRSYASSDGDLTGSHIVDLTDAINSVL